MNSEIVESFRWCFAIVWMVLCSSAGKVSADLSERPVCREHTEVKDTAVEDIVDHLVPSVDSDQATACIAGLAAHTATADRLAALDSRSRMVVVYLLVAFEVLELLRGYSIDSHRCYQPVNTLRHSRWS